MERKSFVVLKELTKTQNKVYNLNGIGLQVKEIADLLCSSHETVKKHMKDIKEKLNIHKDKELTAHFFCVAMGVEFEDLKKKVLQITSCIILLAMMSQSIFHVMDSEDMLRPRERRVTARATRTYGRREILFNAV